MQVKERGPWGQKAQIPKGLVSQTEGLGYIPGDRKAIQGFEMDDKGSRVMSLGQCKGHVRWRSWLQGGLADRSGGSPKGLIQDSGHVVGEMGEEFRDISKMESMGYGAHWHERRERKKLAVTPGLRPGAGWLVKALPEACASRQEDVALPATLSTGWGLLAVAAR